MSRTLKALEKTARFLTYVLVLHPDKFGLIPDSDGFYKIKTVLQALGEDPQSKYINRAKLQEICLSLADPPFEIDSSRIRPRDLDQVPVMENDSHPPKLLFTTVRRKAHAHVNENGIGLGLQAPVILAADKNLALRMGKRKDNDPVLLTVNTDQAAGLGVSFNRFGKLLYLAEMIPCGCFSGPRLSKPPARHSPTPASQPKPAGSFFLDPESLGVTEHRAAKKTKRKKDPEWKRQRRKSRKR